MLESLGFNLTAYKIQTVSIHPSSVLAGDLLLMR